MNLAASQTNTPSLPFPESSPATATANTPRPLPTTPLLLLPAARNAQVTTGHQVLFTEANKN
ncbi:hypothetical protein E2C01_091508 [Portunus trituberculatus]|uniref:Uncharacterized protein n=1 Tax=Portunus trituberculatus TaxID=210409 RepID=A0A5B7JHP5_PORTR|nr:hypothetical protein [Portunus trituberculatus]